MTCNSKISLYSREWCRQWPGLAGHLCTLVRPPSWSQNTCYYASTQTLTHCGHRAIYEQRVIQHTVVVVRRESSDTGSMAETSTLATLATMDLGTGEGPGSSLHWTDYLVIVGYFLSVIVVSRYYCYGETSLQSIFNVLRLGLCHHSRVKETRWTGIFWQAEAWIGSR